MGRNLWLCSLVSAFVLAGCSTKDSHPIAIGSEDATGIDPDGSHFPDTAAEAPETTPASCSDGVKNDGETDVDCGGATCAPCDTGGKCKGAGDCASGVCGNGGTCAAPKCDDKVKNGNETDVDCGNAPCAPCADGKACENETHCQSGVCTLGKCMPPTCGDGVKNHGETDIDCGGPCSKCGVGKKCAASGDCTSASCLTEAGVLRCLCPSGMTRTQLAEAGGGAYCIDANEVTNAEYGVFLSIGPDPKDQDPWCLWNDNFTPTGAWPASAAEKQLPVRYVDWCDAFTFCKKQGKRLCGKIGGGSSPVAGATDRSSSQWYNACSQGGTNVYPYGNTYQPGACNGQDYWSSGVPTVLPEDLASLKSKCIGGPAGDIFELSGNVKEWEDSCDATSGGATDNCLARGGSFESDAIELKCTGTASLPRNTHAADVGFRCCL